MAEEIPTNAQAQPAKELKIGEVMNCDTGEFINVRKFITSHSYGEIFPVRHEIKRRYNTDNPLYICAYCGVAPSLISPSEKNRFHFRHRFEDGRCPAKTRGSLSQAEINAMRYNNTVESEPHKLFKRLMYDCLTADKSFRDTKIESRRVSSNGSKKYRTPDVSSFKNNIFHAFEIQLSTTFVDVILARQEFYKNEGAILVWVLPDFDPTDRRMMEEDIFFHNNCNVMIFNAKLAEKSIGERKLYLGCWYLVPSSTGEEYSEYWKYTIVTFDDLKIDVERQRVYFYDYETQKKSVRETIANRELKKTRKKLRNDFECFWLNNQTFSKNTIKAWDELKFSNYQWNDIYGLNEIPFEDNKLTALLNSLYSAKYCKSIGWNFPDIVKVGHHIHTIYYEYFPLFCTCLSYFKHSKNIEKIDNNNRLSYKIQETRKTSKLNRQQFILDPKYSKLIELLFSEPFLDINNWIGNSKPSH